LQKDRDEIDAALRALTRVAYQDFPQTPKVTHHTAPTTTKRKRRQWTAAEKAAISKKVKAAWAKRRAGAKKG
jgi:hypothetical protein